MHQNPRKPYKGLSLIVSPLILLLILTVMGIDLAWSGPNLGEKKTFKWRERNWIFAPAINGGKNKLLKGYEGYDDLGNAGVDLYISRVKDGIKSGWADNILSRLSFDYFPLQVPKGVLNLEEDMFSVNFSLLYQFKKPDNFDVPRFIPFLGVGIGTYQDRVTLNSPATGRVEGKTNSFGLLASVGLFVTKLKFFVCTV